MKYLLTLFMMGLVQISFAQSVDQSPKQSIIYDAIEMYYASKGITYYFRQVDRPKAGLLNIEVIDLYNQQRVGNLEEVTPATITTQKEKIVWFIRKFNSRMAPLTPTDVLLAGDTVRAYSSDSVALKSKAILAAFKAKYPNNTFNESTNAFMDSMIDSESTFFKWNKRKALAFFDAYVSGDVTLKNIGTDIGGGFAQNLGEGLAQFLVERANEELRAAVFRRLLKAFEEHEELPLLFPSTYEFLLNVDDYNFDLAIKTIQVRAEKDISNLLSTVPKLAGLSKYQSLINKHPEAVYVLAAMTTLDGLSHKLEPSSIIDSVYFAPYTNLKNDHASALKLAGYFSQSLQNRLLTGTDKDQNKNWILINNIWYGGPATNSIAQLYLKLLVLKDPGIGFKWVTTGEATTPSVKPFALLQGKLPTLEKSAAQLLQLVTTLNRIIDSRNTISGKPGAVAFAAPAGKTELPKRQDIHALLDNIFSITESGLQLIPDDVIPEKQRILAMVHKAQESLPLVDRVIDIGEQIKLKNYNEVIFNTGLLVKEILDNNGELIPEEYFQFGNFLASVAIAKSGADVKAAIDAVALPSGSSSIKKDLAFNAAINGYVGYFYRDLDKDEKLYDGFTETHGITAPVGVTISTGFGKRGSLSAFLGVFDVGAIVKYQVSDDEDDAPEPTIEWGNILSPGIHLVYGFPGYLPFSIGIGNQWLPRKMEDNKLKFNSGFNFFVAFDIPIINVASSKKRTTYAKKK